MAEALGAKELVGVEPQRILAAVYPYIDSSPLTTYNYILFALYPIRTGRRTRPEHAERVNGCADTAGLNVRLLGESNLAPADQ